MKAQLSRLLNGAAAACLSFFCLASPAAEQLIHHDTFDGQGLSQLNPFWTPRGSDVVLGSPPGWVSIQQNVIDDYAQIDSKDFDPVKSIRVRLSHFMFPSPSRPNNFFPSISFRLSNGEGVGFVWLRSNFSPDYCNQGNGFDKILVRDVDGCRISGIASSSKYNRNVISEIRFDVATGVLQYDDGADGTVEFQTNLRARDGVHVIGINVSGYGWFTGHRHEIDEITIAGEPAPATGWALPMTSPTVTQDFNCFGCVTPGKFHLGMDMTSTASSAVVAAAAGEIHAVYRTRNKANVWCEGGLDRTGEVANTEHNFGNTVILKHAGPGGETVYTQYSHLNCLSKDVALRALDHPPGSAQRTLNRETFLGNFGGSGNTSMTQWPQHLHFEVKSFGELFAVAPKGNGNGEKDIFSYGAAAGKTYGYFDPIKYLYAQKIVSNGTSMGIVTSQKAVAWEAPGLAFGSADLLASELRANALVSIIRRATMPDGDWYQVNLGLPTQSYTSTVTLANGAIVTLIDNNSPEGWVHSQHIVPYNGFTATVPGPEGALVNVTSTPGGTDVVAKVLGGQVFQRMGVVPVTNRDRKKGEKGKKRGCTTQWVELHLGVVVSGTGEAGRRTSGWICQSEEVDDGGGDEPPPVSN